MTKNHFKHLYRSAILFALLLTFSNFAGTSHSLPQQAKTWKILKIKYTYQKNENGAGPVAKSGWEGETGTFTFIGDSTLSYSYTVDGMQKSGVIKLSPMLKNRTYLYYTVTDSNKDVVRNSYTVIEEEETNMEIQGNEVVIKGNSQFSLNAMFYLKK